MEDSKQDTLMRAYATLTSLRKNIVKMTGDSVPETYVNEYHVVLDRCEAIGIDVAEFRIPDSEIKPRVIYGVYVARGDGGGDRNVSYSKEKYVDKSFILTKLDAILSYLEIITSEKPREIGFDTSGNK